MKIVDGRARLTGLKVSLIVPPAMARDGAKQNPARKRRTQTPAKLWLNPTPNVNRLPSTTVPRYTGYLPTVSDKGPPTTGPSPSARTYSERGSIATVLPTPNSSMNWLWAGDIMDTPTELCVELADLTLLGHVRRQFPGLLRCESGRCDH